MEVAIVSKEKLDEALKLINGKQRVFMIEKFANEDINKMAQLSVDNGQLRTSLEIRQM